jgi:hypothetical protein
MLRRMVTCLVELAVVGARDLRELVTPFVEALLELRQQTRAQGLWTLADTVRARLTAAGVPHLDSLFAESSLDCPLVGVHPFGDLGGGPAVFVELGGLVDLFGAQAGSTHRCVVSAQDPACRLAVDFEQVA